MQDCGKYESERAKVRNIIAAQPMTSNLETINLFQQPKAYETVFQNLIAEFVRLKEGWKAIEEVWLYLLDTVYQVYPNGFLMLEEEHKRLFRSHVMNDTLVSLFVETVFTWYEKARQSQHKAIIRLVDSLN